VSSVSCEKSEVAYLLLDKSEYPNIVNIVIELVD
jgi:hypothetical protein